MSESVRKIPRLSMELANIAMLEGEPHLLDTPAERGAANDIFSKALKVREGSDDRIETCEIDILEKAQDLLDDGGRLQVNTLFGDIASYRCRGFVIFGNFIGFDNVKIELLTELDDDEYAGFYVYHHGGGIRTILEKITFDLSEWNDVTAPLRAIRPHRSLVCSHAEREDAPLNACDERTALKKSVSQFELVAGPKAGTKEDIGGLKGNSRIGVAIDAFDLMDGRDPPPDRGFGQQDCINEMQTTRGFVDLLIRHGLILHHSILTDSSYASLPPSYERTENFNPFYFVPEYKHIALMLHEKSIELSMMWILDSWPYDNGEYPDLLPADDWLINWAPKFGLNSKYQSVNKRSAQNIGLPFFEE